MMSRSMMALSLVLLAGTSVAFSGLRALGEPMKDGAAAMEKTPAKALAAAKIDWNAPLPEDASLVRGKLDNGLAYIIKHHTNPAGRASVWMHMGTGSLNETDQTRGIAHFLEHMAFNGSENFPPGSVINYFQEMGLQFGRDQNAFTSFDQTVYQLALPDNQPGTLDKAMMFMADVAGRLSLPKEEIDSERGVILEERRTRIGSQQRVQDFVFERLAPESTLGRRLPIGTPETVGSVSQEDFRKYWGTYYGPGNATVIVVGDIEPAAIAEQIKKQFGGLKGNPKPEKLPVGIAPSKGLRAIVATDPEMKSASVNLTKFEAVRAPSTTLGDARRDFVELIGTWAFNRRVAANLEKGEGRFLRASAGISDMAGAARMLEVDATGKPEQWREMLTDLAAETQRARLHGFTQDELDAARAVFISGAEESVKGEATLPARAVIARINESVKDREPALSAAQSLEMIKSILPTITVEEVGAAFKKNFDPSAGVFVVSLPASANAPSESEVVEAGTRAFAVTPQAQAAAARVASLLKAAPTPGKIADVTTDQASEVVSGWLPNGVRVHFRKNDQRKNEVGIGIVLATGEILEDASNHGITQAAARAFSPGSQTTRSLTTTQIREYMSGKKANVGGGPGGDDAVFLRVSGSPEGLETALQLTHALLTEPKVDANALHRWADAQKQAIERRKSEPRSALQEVMAHALYPKGDARQLPLEVADIERITPELAQRWLDEKIITAPMEVTVVGDIEQSEVMPLVERYLGSLPKRARISTGLYADQRILKRPLGPIAVTAPVQTQTQQAVVLDGFFGADGTDVADSRTLQMASRILSTRMIKTIREEKRLVYSIGASHSPATAYAGYGMFTASAPTEPAKAEPLGTALNAMYDEFAKDGPTAAELKTAQLQMDKTLEESMKEPNFWTTVLGEMDYRGKKLQDFVTVRQFYAGLTTDQVREVFAKYATPERRFRVTVVPAGEGAATGEAGAKGGAAK